MRYWLMILSLLASGCEGIFLAHGVEESPPDAQASYTDGCLSDAGAGQADAEPGSDPSNPGSAPPPGALAMKLTAVGSPTWKPECAYAFAAPCGTKATGFSTAAITIQKILPAHTYSAAQNVMAPVTAHSQYAQEIPNGLKAAGISAGSSFNVAELQPPSCIFVLLHLVPGASAPVGASPDFASGPILDPSAFPMLIDGGLSVGGKLVDPALDFEYPAKNSLSPEPAGMGYSHLPLCFFESSELVAAQPGAYALDLRITDAQRQGWQISVGFAVK